MSRIPDRIEHEGRIIEISENFISVEILSKSACAGCHAKGVCAASDESVKVVEVPLTISTLAQDYSVGETVNVILKQSLGIQAIWIAYVVPLVLLVISLFVFSSLKMGDLNTGLFSLGVLALYYAGVFLFRKKLSKIFTFSIEKTK